MTEIDVHFVIFYPEHTPISNHTLYEVRREITTMLRDCGFGEITPSPTEPDKFTNTFAIPIEDQYLDNELSILFSFNMNENMNNNRNLSLERIQDLHNLLREQYHLSIITVQRLIS